MVKPANLNAIERETQTSWQEWCAFLDGKDAATVDHNGIVKLAREFRQISGWWAQEIAVAYEQHIGRRLPGQMSDGTFSASVSRRVPGDVHTVHRIWCGFAEGLSEVDGVAMAAKPTTSETPKRLYWRCKFLDGSAVSLGMEALSPEKVLIGIEHKKLVGHDDIQRVKVAWAVLLDDSGLG